MHTGLMQRRQFLAASTAAALCPRLDGAAPPVPGSWSQASVLPAPDDPAQWPTYREALARWREEARIKLKYDGQLYSRPDFNWVSSSYACCFLMMCDEAFYDRRKGRFAVDAWIEHGIREFGGYDSVVLWHAYPRIGLDERNQFDFYRDMPGGLEGVRQIARAFQARGLKVYVNYNPWDQGTRREGIADLDALAEMVRAIGANGIFLDTMSHGAAEFRSKLDAVQPGVVLESELALPLGNIHDHHMSWAQGFTDSTVPGVLRNKWFERRHMQHQIKRWNHDHTGELQAAWMNGSGVMVWENVFGSWVGWSPRDRSILRSMLPIQRRYSALFAGEGWTPLVPVELPGVYASLWEDKEVRLWTVVNSSDQPREGTLLKVAHTGQARYFDLVQGTEVKASGDTVSLAAAIRPRGIACFLAAPEHRLGHDFRSFLLAQAATEARADFGNKFPARPTLLRDGLAKALLPAAPPAMAAIPGATLEMTVEYQERETGFYTSQDYAPGHGIKLNRPARIRRTVTLSSFGIDLMPVTNIQYRDFLRQSGYKPRYSRNFLKHWTDGTPPRGLEDHPVVWVDLDDARAYAKWAGKRLPTEEEWQYAAQGANGLRYPWGDEMRPGMCNAGETGGTTPVKAFPGGRSPFGCYDMCGNTWEWTESERSDGRTRFSIIRGGSYFEAKGSRWYTDGGPRPCSFGAKFLLMWPGLDRCATIGFRCAGDLPHRG